MKKKMMKLAAISMTWILAISMVGCGNTKNVDSDTAQTAVVNPVTEMSEEEMTQKTGIDLPLPEEAEDVIYSVIETGEDVIAQVTFTLNEKRMYLRACMTSMTSLGPNLDIDAPAEEVLGFDMTQGNISGLFYKWNASAVNMVQEREALVNVSKEGAGYLAWLDVVPGILYNLCMEKDADMDTLLQTAEEIFVPMQGEV